MNILKEFDEFVEFCSEHGHLRSHKKFGEQYRHLRLAIEAHIKFIEGVRDGSHHYRDQPYEPGSCNEDAAAKFLAICHTKEG